MPTRLQIVRSSVKDILTSCDIIRPPVNLPSVVKSFGLKYAEVTHFRDQTEACITPHRANRLTAIVNANLPATDCRFTLAHQLYHYHFEQGFYEPEVRVRIFTPGDLQQMLPQKRRSEEMAEMFAIELLVPTFLLQKHFHTGCCVQEVASVFQVREEIAFRAFLSYAKSLLK